MKTRIRITRSKIGSALGAVVLLSGLFATSAWAADPASVNLVKSGKDCPHCDLSVADLSGLMAIGRDLSDADLNEAKLYKANLSSANLTGAVLTNTDLSGANLKNAVGANLNASVTDSRTVCPNGASGPCVKLSPPKN